MKPGLDLAGDPAIETAAQLILAGQVVAVPTETVYGLAADATNKEAVERIFAAKNRPSDNPLIVHIHDLEMVRRYCGEIDSRVEDLARSFWPGPLTLVLKAGPLLRETVCRGLDSVALRMPDHPIIQALIARVDVGLAAPSANLSGKPSPTHAEAVFKDLQGRIPLILDGGPCQVGLESTVLDMTSGVPTILRPGKITPGSLSRILGCPVVYAADEEARRRSPGTRYRHYSPDATVFLLHPAVTNSCRQLLLNFLNQQGRTGYVGWCLSGSAAFLHLAETPDSLPAQLYRNLRLMDEQGIHAVIIDGVLPDDEHLGLMDRLSKAASFHFSDDADLQKWVADQR